MNKGNTNTTSKLSFIRLYQLIQIGDTDTTLTLNIIRLNQHIQIRNKGSTNTIQFYQQIQIRSKEVKIQ